jgi:hypothetical protein
MVWYWLAMGVLCLWGVSYYWRLHNWLGEKGDLIMSAFCFTIAALFCLLGYAAHNPRIWDSLGCSVGGYAYGGC